MPLVRIDIQQGRTPEQVRELADAIQDVMLETFAAPPRDRYQVVTEHPAGQVICEDTGLGLTRTRELVVIQVTQQGRTAEQKTAMYAGLAATLRDRCELDPADLVVSVTENSPADWSFGLGRAQFLTGEL